VIDIDKLSLPLCALGAGAAHVVVLGLVLPLSIMLPGPSESMTPTQVAISVEILPKASVVVASPAAQPEASQVEPAVSPAEPEVAKPQVSSAKPQEAQPDTINALLQNVSVTSAPEPVDLPGDTNDITGSLPEAALVTVTPSEVVPTELVPTEIVPAEVIPDEIASDDVVSDHVAEADAVMPPLPTRVRRDVKGNAIITVRRAAPKPVRRTVRVNPPRPATAKRATGPFQGALGALFGKAANNRTR
jgi:hypothetical protein